jgi:glycosyltransferase involved in cell wall biosynthesis
MSKTIADVRQIDIKITVLSAMESPQVSIVVPTHNRAELLREAVASVLNQTFQDFELLVVDDGSTDHTREVISGFRSRQLTHVAWDRCGNLSMLRNAGIRQSSGQWIAFLDSDDLWRRDKLALQAELFRSEPGAGFVVSGYDIFSAAGAERTKLYGQERGSSVRSIFDDLIRGRITLCSSSVLIRRTLIDQAGPLNETLRTGDYEFFTRLAWHALAAIVHQPLVRVRKHEGNSSRVWNAEGLVEAIYAVRRFYSLGIIGQDIRDDRLAKYEPELASILLQRENQKVGDH